MLSEKRNYDILWEDFNVQPSVQIKKGIRRKLLPLASQYTGRRDLLVFLNSKIELKGRWDNSPGFGSLLSLKLTNISSKSLQLTRLVFPTDSGLDNFLEGYDPKDISFLRNGYQSWSTARTYTVSEKPLRPWFKIVSLASSNMANLPSNTPGILSSEMYSVISQLQSGNSFLVGQAPSFNQFFYIRLNLASFRNGQSHFELVYDFGRKTIQPGEEISLDGIIMARGETHSMLSSYFDYINSSMNIELPAKNIKGYCTWYYFYDQIKPASIMQNVQVLKKRKVPVDLVQIDDGYQTLVGDWLDLKPEFQGKMEQLAADIRAAGYKPGLWLAPFIADRKSNLVKEFPDYILRTEFGRPIVAGFNPLWPGKIYYALDITNPRCEEYIRAVVRTIVHVWRFDYLKLDFLYGGCMRGGNHHNMRLSRAEVLKYGMQVIREEAGENVTFVGCGMPLSTGIGNVQAMRVGPDTAPVWRKIEGFLLRTGAMLGARNSIRNFLVRSSFHKKLWLNDPDCLMLRKQKTSLKPEERLTQINAIIISGGMLLYSDDFAQFGKDIFDELEIINHVSDECFKGNTIALDLMEHEVPEILFNTSGYLALFNFKSNRQTKRYDIGRFPGVPSRIKRLRNVWTGQEFTLGREKVLTFKKMQRHSSLLFEVLECDKPS
jgi:alpha-galactosidase